MPKIFGTAEWGEAMKRDIGLKQRETGSLPPEKLRDILSQIYPEETVEELMNKFVEKPKPPKGE